MAHQSRSAVEAAPAAATQTVSSLQAAEPSTLVRAPQSTAGRYWPWWAGAIALGSLTITFWLALRSPLGVSGSWDKVVGWRRELRRQRQESEVAAGSADEVMKALMAETLAQFGEDAVDKAGAQPAQAPQRGAVKQRIPVTAHLTFLLMIGVGGLLSSVLGGTFELKLNLGPEHSYLFGEGLGLWWALFCGGFLVGFGTRLGGGCTSGHGLSGLACLQPGSIVGTISFFGMAVIVSFLIEALLT